ncbi:hypothetical protein V1511DRAFT_62944 [Dipodascopsis uninucleata]
MVLHNSKWDRKAREKYMKKHGIQNTGDLRERDKRGTPSDDQTQDNQSTRDDNIENNLDDGQEHDSSTNSEDETDKILELPSNASRYQILDAEQDEYVAALVAKEMAESEQMMKYANSLIKERNDLHTDYSISKRQTDDISDIFESRLDLRERESSRHSNVFTYDKNDQDILDLDKKIDHYKFIDSVKQRYKLAARREREAELDRLNRLPASMARKTNIERNRSAGQQRQIEPEEEFDKFWSEIDVPKVESSNPSTSGLSSSRINSVSSQNSDTNASVECSNNNQDLKHYSISHNIEDDDEDEKFLDDLLLR